METLTSGEGSADTRSPDAPRALVGAAVGNAVEWYDFAIFGASALVLADVFFAGTDHETGLALTFAVFATSFVARPVGALMIGTRADRIGRRGTLSVTIAVMTAATVTIGILPVAVLGGHLPALLLIGCRLIQGFSAGGEISSSVPFVLEYAPDAQRGRYSGWHLAGVSAGLAAGTATVALVFGLLPPESMHEWGWRIPFLLAAPLGLVGLYLRLRLGESPLFETARAPVERRQLAQLWHEHRAACVYGFAAVLSLTVPFNVWFIYFPTYLMSEAGTPPGRALGCAVLGMVAAAGMAPLAGRWSDRLGRRPVLTLAGITVGVVAVPAFLWAPIGTTLGLLLINALMGAAIGALVVPAFVGEPFPTRLRASGVACTFGLASAIFGGTAPLMATALTTAFSQPVVVLYVLAASGLGVVVAIRAPETAFASLTAVDQAHRRG